MTILKTKIPCCKVTVYLDGGSAATFAAKRKCRKCGARWIVTTKPLVIETTYVAHEVNWLCIEGAQPEVLQ